MSLDNCGLVIFLCEIIQFYKEACYFFFKKMNFFTSTISKNFLKVGKLEHCYMHFDKNQGTWFISNWWFVSLSIGWFFFCRSPVGWVYTAFQIFLFSTGLWHSTWHQSYKKHQTVRTFVYCHIKSFLRLTINLIKLTRLYIFCMLFIIIDKMEAFSGLYCL